MASWWIVSVNFGIPYVTQTSNPTTIGGLTGESGPFPTKAAAEAAVPKSGLGPGGGTSGTGAGTWWVILTGTTSTDLAGKTVQSSTRPAKPAGALSQVLGPYQTHDEAYTAELDDLGGKITAKDGNPVSGALTGLNAIGDFFSRLEQAGTWVRAGEVVLGILLLGIGLARITGAQNIVSKIAKAKVIPI